MVKRLNKRWLILSLLLIVLASLLWLRKMSVTDHSENAIHDFAIHEPATISRVFMVNKAGDHVDLKKNGNGWTLNDSFDAWQSRVESLLNETISKVKVKGTVPKAARNNVLRRMEISGIKVEIYTGNTSKPELVYYVGGTTPDLLGTYFLKEGDKDPFVLYLPDLNGYLSTRYSLDLDDWISRSVFASSKEEIKSVEVVYPGNSQLSFKINQVDSTLMLEGVSGNTSEVNGSALRSYLNLFDVLNFEGYIDSKSDRFNDSLRKTLPVCIIKVISTNRGTDILSIYEKPIDERTGALYDKSGNPLTQDTDKYFAFYNKLNRLLLIQDYTFGKVMVRRQDFLMRPH